MRLYVVLIKTKTNKEAIEDIKSPLPFDREVFIKEIKKYVPDLNAEDKTWLLLNREYYSVEFNMGKDKKTDCIMLHSRGSREPEDLFEIIKEKFQCRIYDCSSGEFIEGGTESAFGKWKEYRDKVVGK